MTIRTLTALCAILAIGTATSDAQERQLGVKAGPSFATLAFEPGEGGGYDRRISADGGGFAVFPAARRLALQIEALFTSRGAKLYDPDQDLTGSILLQYLDVPVLARIQGPAGGSTSFHVFVGPYAGIRLSAKRQVHSFVGSIRTGEKMDISDEIERFEFGFLAGAGMDIGRRMIVDGRYSHGLSALNTDRSDGFRIRNLGVSVLMGVRF